MAERSLRIGDRYTLTEDERDTVKDLARQRSSSNRSARVKDAGIGPSSGVAKDMLGMGGEWAFARLIDADPDTSISPRSHARGEDAGDVTFRGRVIDVKTTDYLTGRLVVVPWKAEEPNCVYSLMILVERKPPTFEFRGFATPTLVQEFPDDLGHGNTFAVPQEELLEWIHVPAFLYRCREHGAVSCLDCPDRFFDR